MQHAAVKVFMLDHLLDQHVHFDQTNEQITLSMIPTTPAVYAIYHLLLNETPSEH